MWDLSVFWFQLSPHYWLIFTLSHLGLALRALVWAITPLLCFSLTFWPFLFFILGGASIRKRSPRFFLLLFFCCAHKRVRQKQRSFFNRSLLRGLEMKSELKYSDTKVIQCQRWQCGKWKSSEFLLWALTGGDVGMQIEKLVQYINFFFHSVVPSCCSSIPFHTVFPLLSVLLIKLSVQWHSRTAHPRRSSSLCVCVHTVSLTHTQTARDITRVIIQNPG